MLASAGWTVVGTSPDAASGFQLWQAHRPQVVLVDIQLSGENGIGLARRLLEQDDAPIIVLMSAVAGDDTCWVGLGVAGFLPKTELTARALEALLSR